MTYDEFRQLYKAWCAEFDVQPYTPLAVILNSGSRVYIDKPEQISFSSEELNITRWQNPRKPERYRFADIERIVPLIELPADPGGMSYSEFETRIHELNIQEPFHPFVLELRNGGRIEVTRPTGRGGRFLKVWNNPSELPRSIEFHSISRITMTAEVAPA